MDKLKKTANALDIFFKYTYRIAIVVNFLAFGVILLFLILCLSSPALFSALTARMITRLDFGGILFQLSDSVPAVPESGTVYFFGSLVIGVLELLLYTLVVRCIRRILAPMKEGLPFSMEVSRSFHGLGWLTICCGILEILAQFLVSGSLVRAYDIPALFLSDSITQVTTMYYFDFTFVLTALILFGLSYIFHYGTELQQLSDETL